MTTPSAQLAADRITAAAAAFNAVVTTAPATMTLADLAEHLKPLQRACARLEVLATMHPDLRLEDETPAGAFSPADEADALLVESVLHQMTALPSQPVPFDVRVDIEHSPLGDLLSRQISGTYLAEVRNGRVELDLSSAVEQALQVEPVEDEATDYDDEPEDENALPDIIREARSL